MNNNPIVDKKSEADIMTLIEDVLSAVEALIEWFQETLPDTLADSASEAGIAQSRQIREAYIVRLDTIGTTVSDTLYSALQDANIILQSHLAEFNTANNPLNEAEIDLLNQWPLLLMEYIASPNDSTTTDNVLVYLGNPLWITPLTDDYATVLQQMLTSEMSAKTLEATPPGESDDGLTEFYTSDDEPAPGALAVETGIEPNQPHTVQLNTDQQELVDLLRAELADVIESRDEELIGFGDGNLEAQLALLQNYSHHLERIGSAAEMVGLVGLQYVSAHIELNFQIFSGNMDDLSKPDMHNLLREWPVFMLGYLQDIHDPQSCEVLVNFLQQDLWPEPLAAANAPSLVETLQQATVNEIDENAEPRLTKALPEDISLAIPEDVNKELLDGLLAELPIHTTEFSSAITNLVDTGSWESIDVAQRVAHTLKGAANVVGIRGIAQLSHQLEDILQALTKQRALPPRGLGETLVHAADCLEEMSEALLNTGQPPQDALKVLQRVLDWINHIEQASVPINELALGNEEDTPSDAEPSTPLPPENTSITTNTNEVISNNDDKPELNTQAMLRVPTNIAEELLRLAGENIISNGQIFEQISRTAEQLKTLKRQNQLLNQLGSELEQLVDIRGFWTHASRAQSHDGFDSLEMNQYSELHTFTHRLVEAVTDATEITDAIQNQLTHLNDMAIDQRRLNRDNQETTMKMRMVPVSTIVPRLKRSLRQACRTIGKNADLHLSGVDTPMDSNVLNDLADPLMHLLRNALDHGIESPEQRERSGKPANGHIALTFSRQGDHILVRCQDDGGGFNYQAIQRKATKLGLLAEHSTPNNETLHRIILTPGFTTRNNVSQVSGRGIGMDAVNDSIKKMKGSLSLRSEQGKGSVIDLVIPVTLLATHAILVRVGKQIAAVANRGVEEMYYSGAGELQEIGTKKVYRLGDEVYAGAFLNDLMNTKHAPPDNKQSASALLMRNDDGNRSVVLVQEIIDTRELVVKPLSRYAPKTKGVVGATILGDGSVAPVIDLPQLLNIEHKTTILSDKQRAMPANAPANEQLVAVVVDDSLSARRSLAQFVRDIGLDVRMAKDGLEAIAIIEKDSPSLVLTDLEMPRMNGLELTSHLRANPSTSEIPVIMITSRASEKHQQQATRAGVNIYMTKPFSEDELAHNVEKSLRSTQ